MAKRRMVPVVWQLVQQKLMLHLLVLSFSFSSGLVVAAVASAQGGVSKRKVMQQPSGVLVEVGTPKME